MKKFGIFIGISFLMTQSLLANDCEINLTANDQIKYNKSQVSVDASCKEITIKLANVGTLPKTAMGHNVVISKAEDEQKIVSEGLKVGLANNYVPKDAKVIAHTKITGGGESTKTQFPGSSLTKNNNYVFFCSFPGHSAMMTGKLIVK